MDRHDPTVGFLGSLQQAALRAQIKTPHHRQARFQGVKKQMHLHNLSGPYPDPALSRKRRQEPFLRGGGK